MRMILFLLYYNFCVDECRWIPEVYSNVNTSFLSHIHRFKSSHRYLQCHYRYQNIHNIRAVIKETKHKKAVSAQKNKHSFLLLFYIYFNIRKPISYINIHMIHRRIVPIVVFTTVVTPTYL